MTSSWQIMSKMLCFTRKCDPSQKDRWETMAFLNIEKSVESIGLLPSSRVKHAALCMQAWAFLKKIALIRFRWKGKEHPCLPFRVNRCSRLRCVQNHQKFNTPSRSQDSGRLTASSTLATERRTKLWESEMMFYDISLKMWAQFPCNKNHKDVRIQFISIWNYEHSFMETRKEHYTTPWLHEPCKRGKH